MRKFGLIGYPLGHSFSCRYFSEKFREENIMDCIYENFPLKNIRQFGELIKDEQELEGLNVTIPYKTEIIPLLDDISPEAEEIWAVNVIKIKRRGGKVHLSGFNSDAYGFTESLLPFVRPDMKKALVLGSGGSSKAVVYALKKMGLNVVVVSRNAATGVVTYSDADRLISESGIIVNTTPLGMYPDVAKMPEINYALLNKGHILYDLVYNPSVTEFLRMGKERGCTVINGLTMLHLQAERSWEIWKDDQL